MNNYNYWSGIYIYSGDIKIPVLEYYKDKPINYESFVDINIEKQEAICHGFYPNPYINVEQHLNLKGFTITGHIPFTGFCIYKLGKI